MIDIDEQKQVEAALRERERELSQLVDMVPSHLWRLTPDGEPTFFNKRMVDFLGLDVADTAKPGMSRLEAAIEAVVHPDDAARVLGALNHCLVSGERFFMQYRLHRADGVYRWMSSRAEPMRDQAGRIVQWYGLCHDIHDQMHAEEALRRSERQLQQLIDAVPAMIWSTTREGTPSYVNKRFTDVTGATLDDITAPDGSPSLSVIHPDDRAAVAQAVARSFKTGVPYVVRYRQLRRGGSYRWTEARAEPLREDSGDILQWYGVSVDIDDLVTAQEALRDRERELSLLVDMVPSYLWRLTPNGEASLVNKRLVDFLGVDAADKRRLEEALATIFHPDDAKEVGALLGRCLLTGESFSMRYRLRRADGVYRWMSGRAEPLRDESGRIIQWFGLCHDIDDQMRLYSDLQEREAKMRQLVDSALDAVLSIDDEGHVTEWNVQAEAMFGWRRQDALGRRLSDLLIPARYRSDHERGMRRFLASEEGPWLNRRIEISALRRTGGEFPVEVSIAPYRVGGTWAFHGFIRDISDRKLAEAKLAQAIQAASLAVLSASIAHEVNQPLAAIVANSLACHRWLSAEPPNVERAKITAERITRDAISAADVVSRIRALFRQAPQAKSSEDVNHLISEVCRLMADEIAAKAIHIETDLEPDLPPVALDRVQVQQVFVNLIRNGLEAMDTVIDGERALQIRSCRDGLDAIRVEVRDAGSGFKDTERVFEPFFTTKQHGMGMGLAICRSVIEAHGGRLWTANNETQGATVAFTLSLAASEVQEPVREDRLRGG